MIFKIVFLITVILFNIIMWAVFLAKFKKLFSAGSVVDETRDILNKMLMDINNNAARNINLLEDKIRELKEVSAMADEHILLLKREVDKKIKEEKIYKSISEPAKKTRKNTGESFEEKRRTGLDAYLYEKKQGELFTDESLPLENQVPKSNSQKTASPKNKKNLAGNDKISVMENDLYPLNYTKAANPVKAKKTVKQRIFELHEKGKSDSEIAYELGLSLQEVKFSLEIQ